MESLGKRLARAVDAYTAEFGQTIPGAVGKLVARQGLDEYLIQDLQAAVQAKTPIQDWNSYVPKLLERTA